MTAATAEIVVEFVKGRPDLEATVRKKMTDAFRAPEEYAPVCADLVKEALSDVTDGEKALLDRMRGNGNVVWEDVARAFGAPIDRAPPAQNEEAKTPRFDWEKARVLGAALSRESSALSTSLAEFERRVVGLDLGVEATVEIDKDNQLRFGKQNGKWGLYVVMTGPNGGQYALHNAPRALCIGAAHQLVALLARLVENGERTLEEVRAANEGAIDAIEIAGEVEDER
jgi:hypothetical protein